jgi:hypothetical protein
MSFRRTTSSSATETKYAFKDAPNKEAMATVIHAQRVASVPAE